MNSTVAIPSNSVASRLGWFAWLSVAILVFGTRHCVRAQDAADFTWATSQNSITITGYQGPGGPVIVPAQIDGLPVTEIGTAAFFGNTNLTQLTLPDGITTIGDNAFEGCTGLSQLTLPDGVRDIKDFAFHGCSRLTEVSLGRSLENLTFGLFAGCVSLTELSIPDSVQYVSEQFSGHETLAFSDCRALRQVHLGRGLTEVRRGWAEFFATCPNLTAVSVADDHPAYRSIGGVLFSRDLTELVFIPRGQSGRYEVPASVVSLGFQSMRDCDNLEEVVLPEGLVSVGDQAFVRCTRLRHLALPNSVTSLGEYAFSGCTGLVSVRFHGNAPLGGEALGVWVPDGQLTVFYLPGTTGWGSDFGGVPTTLWLPAMRQPTVAEDPSRGSFGFAVDWAPHREVTVEACSDLAHRDWQRVGSLTLDAAGTAQFRDPDSSDRPTRFYRLRTP